MSQPYLSRHIGHFAESVNQALLKLRYPEFYPEVTDWYFPRFKDDEFAWSKTYLQLLLELFPREVRPKVHFGDAFKLKPELCFRSVVEVWIRCEIDALGPVCVQRRRRFICRLRLTRFDEGSGVPLCCCGVQTYRSEPAEAVVFGSEEEKRVPRPQ